MAHHGQNLWWVNSKNSPRPPFSHCIPIGLENRYNFFGGQLHLYVDAMKKNIDLLKSESNQKDASAQRPLLLVAFHPKRQNPDRKKALLEIGIQLGRHDPPPPDLFYNYTQLSHKHWLEAITFHRFTMAPFGHGVDTYILIPFDS